MENMSDNKHRTVYFAMSELVEDSDTAANGMMKYMLGKRVQEMLDEIVDDAGIEFSSQNWMLRLEMFGPAMNMGHYSAHISMRKVQ